jgi:hypothetical protein
MALLDLSLVTQTLTDLIRIHVDASDAWSGGAPDVTALPPDKLEGENTLGFYLYHVTEEIQNKTAYVPGVSDAPVRYNPMTLNLYYVLTAHSDLDGVTATHREQLMMGLAMKALHDHPFIDDNTEIDGTQIMQPLLRGRQNRFKISMLPVQRDHAVDYWMAGQSPLRLAAYYHIAHALLEPEEPQVRPGRVLAYNVYVLPSQNPRVDATENLIMFTLPGESEPRALELRPAQVTYDAPFSVIGTAFFGERLELRLRRADMPDPLALDADPAAWNIAFGAQRITASARLNAGGFVILPGVYSISVRAERWRTGMSGTVILDADSNETPFVIAPRIDTISVPDGAGRFDVTGLRFAHPDLPADAVQVYIGAARLNAGDPNNLQAAQFGVIAAADPTDPTDLDTLRVRLPAAFASGVVSLRVIVNGAENAPAWVTVP